MAYDEGLAQRVREELEDREELVEKKMFGGIGFMLLGNMCCAVNKDGLMVRVGLDNYESTLAKPHTREMDVGGRPMKGWVQVASEGLESDQVLADWVSAGQTICANLTAQVKGLTLKVENTRGRKGISNRENSE